MRKTMMVAVVSAVVGALVAVPVAVYASHSFTDVSDSNTFHDDIAWLKDSGVTKGCNPPENTEYCPDDNVTRGQMAAFMRRLAENRVVDAGTVDGLASDEMASVAGTHGSSTSQGAVPFETETTIEEISISAPSEGFLFIQADASYRWDASVELIQWLQLDDTLCETIVGKADSVDLSYASLSSSADRQTASNGAVIPVAKGNHTLTLCVYVAGQAGATPQLGGTSLEAIFLASGKTEDPMLP
jgi:hypothetical protein